MKLWKKWLIAVLLTIGIILAGGFLFFQHYFKESVQAFMPPTFNWSTEIPNSALLPSPDDTLNSMNGFVALNDKLNEIKVSDFKPLGLWIKDAKYIGLGEVTHGSSENFLLKNQLVRYLIEFEGARSLVLETNIADGYKLNEYVTKGIGDPKQLLIEIGVFSIRFKEYVALLEYLKTYNKDRLPEQQVEVFGYDIQAPQASARLLLKYLDECGKWPEESVKESFEKLGRDGRSIQSLNPFSVWFGYKECSNKMLDFLQENKLYFIKKTSIARYAFIEHLIVVMQQSWELFSETSVMDAYFKRDQFGYENVKWLSSAKAGRVIITAHNGHVEKKDFQYKGFTPLGFYLSEISPETYFSIGSVFFQGEIRAFLEDSVTNMPQNIQLPPAPDNCVENYFEKFGVNHFLLNIKMVKHLSIWQRALTDTVALRTIGGGYDANETVRPAIFDQQFDALLFFKTSTAPSDLNEP